ncbi:MAG TPA: sugar transferase [Epsilonproteobacteria bacterium]|nr:sugar transferase [Campylobacterota bacterium]HHD72470.1 sugar transferase [Campylobacterota bacterium]
MLRVGQHRLKRALDILLSLIAIGVTWWVILLAWIVATVETRSNGLFRQKRVGKDGKLFYFYKIKTMKRVEGIDTTVTTSRDRRITRSGAFFRCNKIDELPQLFNVLMGSMSFVGPRPDVVGFADRLEGDDRIVLSVRPGITGPASLKYKDEEDLLAQQEDPERYNREVIWPDKVKINKEYIKHWSLKQDINYIFKTIFG